MKGQYFSFDAVIATVIMVLAFSSLVAYWYGAQAVVEERTSTRLADADRVAETLLSPGAPADWQTGSIGDIRQIGIASSFGNTLDKDKVEELRLLADPAGGNYEAVGNLLHAGGNYYVLIERNDVQNVAPIAQIGQYPVGASYVAISNRGVVYEGHPASMRVFLWKQ